MTTYLFIGDRKALDKWMFNQGISPMEHGRSVKLAMNGPNNLRLTDAPIVIVDEDDWYEKTIWDEMAIKTARSLNAIEVNQRRRRMKA